MVIHSQNNFFSRQSPDHDKLYVSLPYWFRDLSFYFLFMLKVNSNPVLGHDLISNSSPCLLHLMAIEIHTA